MSPKRFALIIASYQYQDPSLRPLAAPQKDAEALAHVLANKEIGGFEVKLAINEPAHLVSREIEVFFKNKERDDLLLFYFSGHGIKAEDGKLYFAQADTDREWLKSSSVRAEDINESMKSSRSRRQIMILDCCYSGAFAKGLVAKADNSIGVKDNFEGGSGRIILTASDAMQYAFEGAQLTLRNGASAAESIFTHLLVKGLETRQADYNNDGLVSPDDLYRFVNQHIKDITSYQSPKIWKLDAEGEFYIAQYPTRGSQFPTHLIAILDSSEQPARKLAVTELAELLEDADPVVANKARQVLCDHLEKETNTVVKRLISGALGIGREYGNSAQAAQPPRPDPGPSERQADKSTRRRGETASPAGASKTTSAFQPSSAAANRARISELIHAMGPYHRVYCPFCAGAINSSDYLAHYDQQHPGLLLPLDGLVILSTTPPPQPGSPSSRSKMSAAGAQNEKTTHNFPSNSGNAEYHRAKIAEALRKIDPSRKVSCPFCSAKISTAAYLAHYDLKHPGLALPPEGLREIAPASNAKQGPAAPEDERKNDRAASLANSGDPVLNRVKVASLIKAMGPNRNLYCPFCSSRVASADFMQHYDEMHPGYFVESDSLTILSTTPLQKKNTFQPPKKTDAPFSCSVCGKPFKTKMEKIFHETLGH